MKKQLALLCTLAIAMGVPAGLAPSQSWTGFTAVAQSNRVSGVVKDANGEPMIGVNVRVKGTNTGTTTDLDGRYTRVRPPISMAVIRLRPTPTRRLSSPLWAMTQSKFPRRKPPTYS